MLWYCYFSWHAHTTREKVAQRFLEQDRVGTNHPEMIKGWYALAGGSSGFLLIEADDPRRITEVLQPYSDVMSVDVRAVYELNYDDMRQAFQQLSSSSR